MVQGHPVGELEPYLRSLEPPQELPLLVVSDTGEVPDELRGTVVARAALGLRAALHDEVSTLVHCQNEPQPDPRCYGPKGCS